MVFYKRFMGYSLIPFYADLSKEYIFLDECWTIPSWFLSMEISKTASQTDTITYCNNKETQRIIGSKSKDHQKNQWIWKGKTKYIKVTHRPLPAAQQQMYKDVGPYYMNNYNVYKWIINAQRISKAIQAIIVNVKNIQIK